VCVATDVAARGLDLPDLGLVIHADLPQNKEVLVHRSGRTGRAGKHGVAIVLVPDNARRYVERTFHAAHVEAQWMRAPSAEQIVERDHVALVKDIVALPVDDDDREVAKQLLGERSAEDLVAMLVRQLRSSRPAPEVLTEPASMRSSKPAPRAERVKPPKQPRAHDGEGARWFTINVGRSKNADPKWLIPLLCRRGGISKREIGKIQILQRETRVEISADASERFAEAVRQPDTKDKHIHIEPVDF
jgi:ATP-dependent RNA helicase DeaD